MKAGAATAERMTVPVTGLACGGGGALVVERMLRRIPGVTAVYVNPANETAYVEFDGSCGSRYEIRRRLTEVGEMKTR